MSLRARMLAGMAVVAFVLVFAAVVIARTTESYLVERVDAQLADAIVPRSAFGRFPELPPAPSGTNSAASQFLNALYVARVDGNSLTVLVTPNVFLMSRACRRSCLAERSRLPKQRILRTSPCPRRMARAGTAFGRSARPMERPSSSRCHSAMLMRRCVDWCSSRSSPTVSVIGILGLVTFWVLRLGVRPIKRMTATAAAIASGDLSQRVPAGHRGTEAGELSDALNAMLTRIEDAFDQRAGLAGASATVRRRRLARAPHSGDDDSRLRGALPPWRSGEERRSRASHASYRAGVGADGLARR